MKQNRILAVFGGAIGAIVILLVAFGAFYIVPEGHVAIVKHTGKAIAQTDPGMHLKIPLLQSIELIEVRERKNSEKLAAATANQLPATAEVSINWTVNKEAAMALFIQYGGLAQFEERVLDPKLRSASKAAISRYRADQIIRDRNTVVAEIGKELLEVTSSLPITITQTQLENVDLPATYLQSVMAKEQAREDAEREKHTLEQQRLQALQKVNTAEAEKQAAILSATGRAEAVRLEAIAEAEAIQLVNEQLSKSPLYIDLVRAKAWNGSLPQTMLGSDSQTLFQIQ